MSNFRMILTFVAALLATLLGCAATMARAAVVEEVVQIPVTVKNLQAQPERVICAVPAQPSGRVGPAKPGWSTSFENWVKGLEGHPEATKEVLDAVYRNMYGPDFLYSVSRDFLPTCKTPCLVLAGNDANHPFPVSEDMSRLLPDVEFIVEWKSGEPLEAAKARIKAYDELLKVNEDRLKSTTAQIIIPPGERLGNTVINLEGVSKAYGDRLLIDNLTFKLPPGGIVGIIGPNGAGKTTLFRMITGQEKPDSGTITIGESVQMGYVDQSRDSLDPDKTVWQEISGGNDVLYLGKREMNSRAYTGAFNFKGADQQQKVGNLSGGERNRVHLAKLLKSGGNVLLLDEPTNDLDVDTLRALETALENFPGCAVVISHDRWFLDRIATHVLAFEGDSQVRWFEGNFSEYEAWRHKELGTSADQPHRIKYKPLAR